MASNHHQQPPYWKDDPFLANFSPAEIRTASEFLSTWLPSLSRGLCSRCTTKLSERIRSLTLEANGVKHFKPEVGDSVVSGQRNLDTDKCGGSQDNCDSHSLGSWKDDDDLNDDTVANSVGYWKDGENSSVDPVAEMETDPSSSGILGARPAPPEAPRVKMSWADMAQEDEGFEGEEETEVYSRQMENWNGIAEEETIAKEGVKPKPQLSREQRELIRFNYVQRKKDFITFERVKGKFVNILEGLELHTLVFSAAEQKRIVDEVERLQEKGRKGELRGRTFSSPQKWIKGKGRVTMQFGCCYNYAIDKNGNPPGILQDELVEPIPPLLKTMIKRLVRWHVVPPSCVPDSCIVNIYDVGDCIPPHIDSHDFLRPFCTVSFLSECSILFGTELKIVGPGEFSGAMAIPLPLGSVLVLNGNGADVAKHCVPAVPERRISITFRKMDDSKCPMGFVQEPDLQGIEPLAVEVDKSRNARSTKSWKSGRRQVIRRDDREENTVAEVRGPTQRWPGPELRQPYRGWQGPSDRWRARKNQDT